MQTLYQIALITHIIGLTTLAGVTLVDFVVAKQFWKQHAMDKTRAMAIHEATSKFPLLFGIGMLLLILSGVTMMGITRGVFGEQIWFRIKFGLIILIIINGVVVGRRQGSKLKRLLTQALTGQGNLINDLSKVKNRINWYHLTQIAFFITIFVLSVFKFN